MTSINRLIVQFVGSPVTGASSTSFYSIGSAATLQSAVVGLFGGLKLQCPPTLNFVIPSTGDVLEDTTGDIVGSWSAGTVSNPAGTGGTAYAAGVGIRLVHETGARTRNRPCRGSNFLVPISSACWDTDGTLNAAVVSSLNSAVASFRTAMGTNQVVWTRPKPSSAGNGGHATVISTSVPDKVSWLRSRRT